MKTEDILKSILNKLIPDMCDPQTKLHHMNACTQSPTDIRSYKQKEDRMTGNVKHHLL